MHAVCDHIGELINGPNTKITGSEKSGYFCFHELVDNDASGIIKIHEILHYVRVR